MVKGTLSRNKSMKRYRQRLKDKGLCTRACGRKSVEGMFYCFICLEKNRERTAKYYAKRRKGYEYETI